MSEGREDEERPNIARRVQELERYCHPDLNMEHSLKGLQERIVGIPPDAVRGSNFFRRACCNGGVTLEMIECVLDAFPDAARTIDYDGCSPLHYACMNEGESLEIVERLLRAFPGAVRSVDRRGWSPLHWACGSKNPDPGIAQLLLDRWPESANHRSEVGRLPLHLLCFNPKDEINNEANSLVILDLLLAAAPDSATIADDGVLPIHLACLGGKSRAFCKRLIDAFPESPRVQTGNGLLPIHLACYGGDVQTVKYILELHLESLDVRDEISALPIHYATRSEGRDKLDIVKHLLAKDPDCASKTGAIQYLPLHMACLRNCLDSVRILFDTYPEAINIQDGEERTPRDISREHSGGNAIVVFLEAQLVYTDLAKDSMAIRTPDENGWLPLHRALRKNASLGAIKLLIAGNPAALQVSDNPFAAFPLHIACGFSSVGVVEYLLGLLDIHLHTLDLQENSTLHYACRGGNVGVVKCLLGRGVPSVSVPNDGGKLPIHLLWESGRVDRNSVEYVDAGWRLLLAHPETVRL